MSQSKMTNLINKIHDSYINEADFKSGKDGYKKFVDLYISLYYEPLNEEYEEARYFTQDFDKNLFDKMKFNRSKRVIDLRLK